MTSGETEKKDRLGVASSTRHIARHLNDSFVLSTISLYVLRQANPNEKWKIQAHFDGELKHDFPAGIALTNLECNSVSLFDMIYILSTSLELINRTDK